MRLVAQLRSFAERIPDWLSSLRPDDPFPRDAFFASRICFYPGAGRDGHAVKAFGSSHAVHCFVHADYGMTQTFLEDALDHPVVGFRGYRMFVRKQLTELDLVPHGWQAHVRAEELGKFTGRGFVQPYGFLEILEREGSLGDDHGPRRLAVLFLGADGIATHDALWCQDNEVPPPFSVLLEDYGFGGQYSPFSAGGLLERIATERNRLPQFLLVSENTPPWPQYERVAGVDGEAGGMHGRMRSLYHRKPD